MLNKRIISRLLDIVVFIIKGKCTLNFLTQDYNSSIVSTKAHISALDNLNDQKCSRKKKIEEIPINFLIQID